MNSDTRKLVNIAILTAVSVVLYMFEIPVFPPLEVDLSDLPVLIAAYTMGAGPGVLVALLKNIVHAFTISKNPGFVGELANFAYAVFVMIPVLAYKEKNKRVYLFFGIAFASFLMHFFNAWVTFPLFGMPAENKHQVLISVFLPVNLVKASVLYFIFLLVKPYLDRRKR